MTTKADHNGIRQRPIPMDVLKVPAQVSDGARQSGRILQAGGQGFESPKLHFYQAKHRSYEVLLRHRARCVPDWFPARELARVIRLALA
jgi:hypothetical protein